ncbi:MAG: hypothetical protein COB53_05375 [Elusimicrobia bacterium]|nr:MAG: hypothetical protein COB53_05375 [Elusimicrobiota bacterium]
MRFLSLLTLICTGLGTSHAAPSENAVWTVSEYVRLSLEKAPSVRRAQDSLVAARARQHSTFAALMLPSLSFSASINPAKLARANRFSFGAWRPSANDWTLSPGASWNLFNNFKDVITNRTRALSTASTSEDLEAARQSQALAALRTYFRLLRADRILEVADRNLDVQKQNYALTQIRYKNGMKSLFDLLKTETDWRSAELNRENRIADQSLARFQFNIAVERREDAPVVFPKELTPGTTDLPQLDHGMRAAMMDRPEIKRSANDIETADLSWRRAKIDAGPTLALNFSYSDPVSGSFRAPTSGFGLNDAAYGLTLSLAVPSSLNFYSQAKNLIAARASWRQSRETRTALHRRIREEVFNAHIQLVRAIRSLEIARRKEDISKQNLELIKEQYEGGSVDVIRLSQVQIDYVNAQIERLDAFRDVHINRAAYRRVIGEPIWR